MLAHRMHQSIGYVRDVYSKVHTRDLIVVSHHVAAGGEFQVGNKTDWVSSWISILSYDTWICCDDMCDGCARICRVHAFRARQASAGNSVAEHWVAVVLESAHTVYSIWCGSIVFDGNHSGWIFFCDSDGHLYSCWGWVRSADVHVVLDVDPFWPEAGGDEEHQAPTVYGDGAGEHQFESVGYGRHHFGPAGKRWDPGGKDSDLCGRGNVL